MRIDNVDQPQKAIQPKGELADCTSVDRYLWEAEAHANELLEHYDQEARELLLRYLTDRWESILPHLQDAPKTAFVFLGEGPAAQDTRLLKLPQGQGRLLWLQARYLALESARALKIAKCVLDVTDREYRRVVRSVAQAAHKYREQPNGWDLEMLRLPD